MLLPLITAGVAALLAFLPIFEPRRQHLAHSFGAYTVIWGAVVVFMGGIHVLAVLAALGVATNMAGAVTAGVGLLFVVIGLLLGQVQSNFLMGIRTPWTLTSERSWRKTHQLGGRLFMALGALVTLTAPFSGPAGVILAVGGALAITATIFVYSYRVWSGDPERRTG
ncbi:MAG: SdpI family protein [Chloroflexi bacterium]|nr:SdpI family protein [Chloroflexota bacterium]